MVVGLSTHQALCRPDETKSSVMRGGGGGGGGGYDQLLAEYIRIQVGQGRRRASALRGQVKGSS